ncbi:MAG TPA: carboxypeptidase regulatory-like domain-containing protein [Acidobacteriaceae bacterium]|nr:carboxypeptidase regulatory-like domain-containing protein [Acidobacteriaceae bacterium]
MRISLRPACGLLLAGTVSLLSVTARAQFRASIQGTVTDSTGAAIPNATVILKDNATNATQTAISSGEGIYNFAQLPPDSFTITASASGFTQKVLQNVAIIPEQANSINIQLELGAVSTSVTVSADTISAIDTATSNIGATISSNDIQHLPSFNRDVFTLTQLVPGTVSDGAQNASGGVYSAPGNQGPGGSGNSGQMPTENRPQAMANGQQNSNNGISIDGISTVSAVWGGSSVITPNEDSIDNVRIVTNNYDAENGRFAGAQTLITSKSGTNQLHGSLFIAIHRPGLNAYQPAVRTSNGTRIGSPQRDTARYNQWGGSLGGPIIKDRVFAFFAYESSPNSSTATSTGWYETSQFRSAAPSGSIASTFLGFPGSAPSGTIVTSGETCATVGLVEGVNCRTISGQGLDIGSPLKIGLGKQDPTATGTAANPGVGSGLDGIADVAFFLTSTPSSSTYQQYNGRLDTQLTQKDRLAFAIYWVPYTSNFYNGGARAYNLFHHTQVNDAFSVIWNHIFTPNFLNEARANASGWRWNELTSNPQQPVGLPQDNITFFGPASGASINQFGTSIGSHLNQWTYGYRDIATKVAGRHTLKFGGEFTKLYYLNNPTGRPSYNFYNIWDFLNDAPSVENGGFNSLTGRPGGNRSDERENMFGAFIQDAWKVLPNLTVNAGLRYSYFGALFANQDNIPRVLLGQGTSAFTNLNVAPGHNLWESPKTNLGPQIGFNWSPGRFENKLVIRGGYGLNFNQDEIAITANLANNPPTQNFVNYSFSSPTNPGANGGNIIYAVSSDIHSLNGFPPNPHAITSYTANGLPTAGNASVTIVGDGHGNLPTTYVQHFSLEGDYELGREIVASLAYQGSVSRHLINHMTPNSAAVVAGWTLNPLVPNGGGDFWINEGMANNNAMLVEVKHPFVHHFSADVQFQWAKSMDTDGSGPYYEDPYYPLYAGYSYGPSDFNVGKQFKAFGLWQPVIFHGGNQFLEKILGEWSLSGILQLHTGFPYSPTYGIPLSLYCTNCGYSNIRPYYLGTGGHDHSNNAFINGKNFANNVANAPVKQTVNGSSTTVQQSTTYFTTPNFASAMQAVSGNGATLSPNVSLPPLPGLLRNAFVGPNYRDFDASIAKGFGLPNTRLLGENAKLEVRADIFNLFNILSLDPGRVSNNVVAGNFGTDTVALGGRTITLQARFSF